jgi:hypothetical protein
MCVCSTAVCTVPGGVWRATACASAGHICSKAACVVPGGRLDGLQQLVCIWTLCLSAYKILCCTDSCPTAKAFVLHLDVSVFKSDGLVSVCLKEFCATATPLPKQKI